MKQVLQSLLGQWLMSFFFSVIVGLLMWEIFLQPVIEQINVLTQNNHHISQKLKSLRKNGNGTFWSAPQLYHWLNANQRAFGIHVVAVGAEHEGIQLVLEGPLKNICFVLRPLAQSNLKSLFWQHDPVQIELLLNAVSMQESPMPEPPTSHQLIGEAGSQQQRYCIYQAGGKIKMIKKGPQC
ncbi:MAG: hypothetical protein NTV32_04810 [Gammaproteobacteria bacterium]|nr:hypothetical protein [Gammaproteobacteria bacterium]